MAWSEVGIGLVSGVVGGAFVAFVSSLLATHREKLSEKREKQRRIREASEAFIDLLTEWIRPRYIREGGKATNEDRWRIQRECWRTLIWLDERLVNLAVKRLANRPDALEIGKLVVEARKILLDMHDTALTAVNHWPPVDLSSSGSAASDETGR